MSAFVSSRRKPISCQLTQYLAKLSRTCWEHSWSRISSRLRPAWEATSWRVSSVGIIEAPKEGVPKKKKIRQCSQHHAMAFQYAQPYLVLLQSEYHCDHEVFVCCCLDYHLYRQKWHLIKFITMSWQSENYSNYNAEFLPGFTDNIVTFMLCPLLSPLTSLVWVPVSK